MTPPRVVLEGEIAEWQPDTRSEELEDRRRGEL